MQPTVTLLLLILLQLCSSELAHSLTYKGCFEETGQQRAFHVSPGDYDPDTLGSSPADCSSRCSVLNPSYAFAGVWRGTFCFCGNSIANTSEFYSTGLSSSACVAEDVIAVYAAAAPAEINDMDIALAAGQTVFSTAVMQYLQVISAAIDNSTDQMGIRLNYGDDFQRWELLPNSIRNGTKTYLLNGVFDVAARAVATDLATVRGTGAVQVEVISPISTLNFTCEPAVLSGRETVCSLSWEIGSKVMAHIDWGDGSTPDNFTVADIAWQRAGYPVATQDSEFVEAMVGTILVDAEFKFRGELRGIEAFGNGTGNVEVIIMRPSCTGGQTFCFSTESCSTDSNCSAKVNCAANSELLCPATENCWTAAGGSCKSRMMRQNVTSGVSTQYTREKTITVAVVPGYNFVQLPAADRVKVMPGDRLAINQVAPLIVARAAGQYEGKDFICNSGGTCPVSPGVSDWTSSQAVQHQVSAVAVSGGDMQLSRNFTAAGNFTATVSLNNAVTSSAVTAQQTVQVVQIISNITFTPKMYVLAGAGSGLSLATHTGTGITYTFTFSDGSGNEVTSSPSTNHVFATAGEFTVNVTAANVLQSEHGTITLTAVETVVILNVTSPAVAGAPNGTVAVTTTFTSGTNYSCTITIAALGVSDTKADSGDFTLNSIPAGQHAASVNCSNPLTSSSKTVTVKVVEVVSELTWVTTDIRETGVAFAQQFSLTTGTFVQWSMLYNGVSKTSAYNATSRIATSQSITESTPGEYNVTANAFNEVSSKTKSVLVTVLRRIAGLQLQASETSVSANSSVNFTITITAGSGVTLNVSFGDGGADYADVKAAAEDWSGGQIQLVRTFPAGTFNVTATATNGLNSLTETVTVFAVAAIGDLQLVANDNGLANIAHGFSLQQVSGSPPVLANATFTWADGTTSTETNVAVGPTYSHTFLNSGQFNVSVSIVNPVSSVTIHKFVRVLKQIVNLRTTITKSILKIDEQFSVTVTLDQGEEVAISVNPGNGDDVKNDSIAIASSTTSRNIQLAYNSSGTYTINVTVCNPVACQSFEHTVIVQTDLSTLGFSLAHDGDKALGSAITFTLTVTPSSGVNVDGAQIIVKDSLGVHVTAVNVGLPTTNVPITPAAAGYLAYTFAVVNNVSNVALNYSRVGAFNPITGLNASLKYRANSAGAILDFFGDDLNQMPSRQELVVLPFAASGYIEGYILTVEQLPFTAGANACAFSPTDTIFKAVESSGEYQLTLTAWNLIYNANITMNFTVANGLGACRIIDDNGVSRPNQLRAMKFSCESLSSSACVLADFGAAGDKRIFGPSICQSTCNASTGGYNLTGVSVENNQVDLNVTYQQRGTYKVSVVACFDGARAEFSVEAAVSTADCKPPWVTMEDEVNMDPKTPRKAFVSQLLQVEMRIWQLRCPATLLNTRSWVVEKLDPTTYEVIETVDTSSIQSRFNTIIVLPARFLKIGLYKFTARVMMNSSITIEEFANSSAAYIQMDPSPLVLRFDFGSMTKVRRSVNREICLQPNKYSFDPDASSGADAVAQGIGNWVVHCYQEGEAEPADTSATPVIHPHGKDFDFSSYTPPASGCFGTGQAGLVGNASSGSLCFPGQNLRPNKVYVFKVQASKGIRKAKASISLITTTAIPANVEVRCRFLSECKIRSEHPGFLVVNPSGTIQLTSTCSADNSSLCQTAGWLFRSYNASGWHDIPTTAVQRFIEGGSNNEASLSPGIFDDVNSPKLQACLSYGTGNADEGEGCLQLYANTLPTVGSCSCNETNVTAGVTPVGLSCSGFSDSDGIESYQFFMEIDGGNDTITTSMISFSKIPKYEGPLSFFASEVRICATATDALDGRVKHCFANISMVEPPISEQEKVIDEIIKGNSPVLVTINKGRLQDTANVVQVIATSVTAARKHALQNLLGDSSGTSAGSGYDDNSANKESLVSKLNKMSQKKLDEYETQRDRFGTVLDELTKPLETMTSSTPNQIELVGNTIRQISVEVDSLPRDGQMRCKNKAVELAKAIRENADSVSKEQLVEMAGPALAATMQTVASSNTQRKRGLRSDKKKAMQTPFGMYDTDAYSKRASQMQKTPEEVLGAFEVDTNMEVQNVVVEDVGSGCMGAVNEISRSLASKQIRGEKEMKITSAQLSLTITKSDSNSLSAQKLTVGRSKVSLPRNLCAAASQGQCSGIGSDIAIAAYATPTNTYSNRESTNPDCAPPVAAEVLTVNLLDANNSEVSVSNTGSDNSFDFFIEKDPTFEEPVFVDPDVNVSTPCMPDPVEVPGSADGPFDQNKKLYQKLILHEFTLTGDSQSMHFEIKFPNATKCTQFLIVCRLWQPPSLSEKDEYGEPFDWHGMLPSHTRFCNETAAEDEPEPYTFFISNTNFTVAKQRVRRIAPDWDKNINKVKCGVRELETEEHNRYTPDNPPPVPYSFTKQCVEKYLVRIYGASCLATRPDLPSWNSSGCIVGPLTVPQRTQCSCSHLTSFAGGWIEAPNTIDWSYVFSNFDFSKNTTLFVTEIVIAVVFMAIFIWARRADKKDLEKLGVTPMVDNDPDDRYLYEVVVNTGMRRGAGTESKVHMILSGERAETRARPLIDSKRKVLQRASVNRFLMAVERPLGPLNYLRVWHDNSGKGSSASWYCNSISVIDLQTRKRFHFVLNRWLAVEEDDGLIDRLIPVAGNTELTNFSYMFSSHTKRDLTEGHLWLSVMARPPESNFTRVERVACCLFLLFLTMVTTCMFYQKEGPSKATPNSLNIGPFSLSPRMLYVGVITNIITFVPLFVVMELFRRSRMRLGYLNQLMKAINDHFEEANEFSKQNKKYQSAKPEPKAKPQNGDQEGGEEEEKKKKRAVKFPWWVRIIAWIILVVGTLTSALFTTFYGVQFGDETCKKWISSLFISFFASVMLSQPMKVLFVAAFMSLLCKKSNVDEEEFMDDEEEVLNEIGQKNGLMGDEEWMHEVEEDKERMDAGIEPPNAELLERAREKRLKEKKMFDIIREIAFYAMFYMLLLFVTFAFRDPNAYELKRQMERLLMPGGRSSTGEGIQGITTEAHFWDWMETRFVPGMRAGPWYNSDPQFYQRGYTGDRVGRLVGYAIMRQKRVKMDSCPVQPNVRHLIAHCMDKYSVAEEESGSYEPRWEAFNASVVPTKPQHEAFRYKTGSELKSFPYMARMRTYSAGGYVFEFRGNLPKLQADVAELKTLQWMDRQTRAVFLEFAFYNPNVNLFGIGTIVFEFEGSGGMIGVYRFEAANLTSFLASDVKVFEIFCQAMFCIMLLVYLGKEIRKIYKQRKEYFMDIWNISEMFILIGSIMSIVAYVYVLFEASRLTGEFAKYGGNVYLNFQYVAFWNEYLVYFTSFIVFVSTLKFIRLLRFNKRMGMLGDAVKLAAKDIRQFFFMFFIIFCAFIQVFYLIFMEQLYGYHTFLHTMEQLMQIALGKFKFFDLYVAEPVIGPLVFAAYTIFVIFILLNMFVAILNESFAKVKDDVANQENEHEMVDFILQKAMMWVGLGNSRVARSYFGHEIADVDYKEVTLEEKLNRQLPARIDNLVKFIEKAYFDDKKRSKRRLNYLAESTMAPAAESQADGHEYPDDVKEDEGASSTDMSRPSTGQTLAQSSNDLAEVNN